MINLLHVEDDADIREIAELSLSLSGEFALVQCNSGEEALAHVQSNTPDAILLDMMMPGLTGRETLEEMRKIPHLADVPAIFMTARAQQSDIEALNDTTASGVISKPFDPMTLPGQIKDVLNG